MKWASRKVQTDVQALQKSMLNLFYNLTATNRNHVIPRMLQVEKTIIVKVENIQVVMHSKVGVLFLKGSCASATIVSG
ncbi:MAG: hypothetical protein ABIN67_08725 [Ferruginibacter sp.]